ncbi:uncharacterized protein LOC124956745 [Vespa velutina]|uniref:uncharacterized protein LOC124956745 n=1 Tax=Vespa velutina TaxID=202808 RepID=UPI001FB3068F|nr:uncharacterized protein LOC124956745 [Vespa velutina]
MNKITSNKTHPENISLLDEYRNKKIMEDEEDPMNELWKLANLGCKIWIEDRRSSYEWIGQERRRRWRMRSRLPGPICKSVPGCRILINVLVTRKRASVAII